MHPHAPSKTQIIIVLVIVAVIGWLVAFVKRTNPQPIPTPTETVTPVDAVWPSAEVKKETVSESTNGYTIDASYPATNDPRITAQFKAFVDEQIAQFKDDTSWANNPEIAPAEADALSLEISYKETRNTRVDNYSFNVVTYTGGAHGLQITQTFSFDTKGKLLKVGDLFTNGEKGLTTISAYASKEIAKRNITDANWIADGAGPKPENYQAFIVGDAGVTFIFDPYQVAPYAAGTQTVVVPLTVFKGIANPLIF